MRYTEETQLNYDDVAIVPEEVTTISSRKECDPYDENGMLPIFASCMSSVVSLENTGEFNHSLIYTVIPRTYSLDKRLSYLSKCTMNFVAFSLTEAEDIFVNGNACYYHPYRLTKNQGICIDLANGHMKKLLEVCKAIKDKYGDTFSIMTGNIANPQTYKDYEDAGVDYCRVGIGGGSVCTTTSNVSVGMPYFSLLKEIYEIKKNINGKCKIIADGNIRGYRDIQKALIYADYVMIGGLFNKAMESAGKTTYGSRYWNIRGYKILRPLTTIFTYGREIPRDKFDKAFKLFKDGKLTIWKWHWGMSTRKAQEDINRANGIKKKTKTAEGKSKFQKVEYDLAGWSENETDYLRSAMSYTNSKNLEEYKDSLWVKITQRRYND